MPRLHQAGDHHRNRALIGPRAFGQIRQGERWRFPQFLHDKELRTGDTQLALRDLVREPDQPNQAPDGVDNALGLGHNRTLSKVGR